MGDDGFMGMEQDGIEMIKVCLREDMDDASHSEIVQLEL